MSFVFNMLHDYEYNITGVEFNNLGYIKVIANLNDKHDRSAPSNYHWKVLKCRMIIFSTSSLLACPDRTDVKQVHIIFNKIGNDYDRLTSLFLKFCLIQDGGIYSVTSEIYLLCFQYTMSAKMAPVWNVLGYNNFINNREFLTASGPQPGIKCDTSIYNETVTLKLKPVMIHFIKSKNQFTTGENVRVLPSLNKGVVEGYYETLPISSNFKCYKDLRRHWKNIHGYRLPEEEHPSGYYSVRFWRGDPLTYPAICLTTNYPIITPIPKSAERPILNLFIECLQSKMPKVLGIPIAIEVNDIDNTKKINATIGINETLAVSLCTPTQGQRRNFHSSFQ